MTIKKYALALMALLIAGCAPASLYEWGNYDQLLYSAYKSPDSKAAMQVSLEKHIGVLEERGQVVAPGLYAELGTLYLEAGDTDRALDMYSRERAAWPESHGLMTAMITNLERRRSISAESEQ